MIESAGFFANNFRINFERIFIRETHVNLYVHSSAILSMGELCIDALQAMLNIVNQLILFV